MIQARQRRWWGAVIAPLLFLATLMSVTVNTGVSQAAGDVDGSVSGTVFQDFGSTGFYTTGSAGAGVPRNRPIAGITATAYDADGDIVGTGESGDDGEYTIDVEGAKSNDLRIEFSDWPEQYQPGFAAQADTPPPSTEGSNDTSVQFVTLAGGAAEDVDFSLVIPDQVIQANAPISTAIEYAGDPADPNNALSNDDALVAQPWSDYGSSDDPAWPFDRVTLATFQQVGAIWGTAYIRNSNMMLASPTVKRMSGLGPGGLGAIYRVDDVLNADGSLNANTPDPTIWFNVSDLDVVNGGGKVDLGTIPSNSGRGLGDHETPAEDLDAFENAAKVGIGGMATSLDGRAMFVANLNDKSVYGIRLPVGDPDGALPTQALRIPTPVGDNQQLWALTTYHDRLYLGYVDTGTRPGQSAADAGMKAYVVSIGLEDLVEGVVAARLPASLSWRTEATVDLGYTKGSNMQGWPTRNTTVPTVSSTCPGSNSTAQQMEDWFPQLTRWNSWTDSWSWDSNGDPVNTDNPFNAQVQAGGGTVGLPGGCDYGTGWEQVYAQPVLSGITFDIDGYMILGFSDRNAIQSGNRNYAAVTSPTSGRYWEAISNGDTLVAAPAAQWKAGGAGCPTSQPSGNFIAECNGVVGSRGPRTAAGGTPNQGPTYNNGEGPVNGEFLNDRRDQGTGANHNESTLGSVVTYPGVDEIASSAMDPYTGINRNGLTWFDQNTGTATRGFDQVVGDADNTSETFQKGGGLGSVALLGVAAPVEIGNRVWLDADLNGRQDPDEPAINGAPVQLWTADADGAPVCQIGETETATIDDQPGTYYFRSDDNDLQNVPCAGQDPVSFTTDGDYVVVFPPGTGDVDLAGPNANIDGFAGLTWDQLQRTKRKVEIAATDSNGGTGVTNDSNPVISNGRAPVSVGGPGENDHTIDAGWYGLAPYELLKNVVGPAPNGPYTVKVVEATNFRGDNRLTQAGEDPHANDPEVSKKSFELTPGTAVASGQDLPYGYTLTFEETDPDLPAGAVSWGDDANPDNPQQGQLVISPTSGEDNPLTLTVTNAYGSFQVVKTNEGPEEAVEAAKDLQFSVKWTSTEADSAGDTSGTFQVKGDGVAKPDPALSFPVGTEVTLSEITPTNLPPGVAWSGGTFTADPPDVTVNDDGTEATVKITGNETASPVQVALTNTFENALGKFSITKQITEDSDYPDLSDPIYDTVEIPITYSYADPAGGADITGTATLNRANDFTFTSPDLPTGTKITVTEGQPTGLPPGLTMTFDGWSGDDITTNGQSAIFTVGNDTTVALTVTNKTAYTGTFSVLKSITGEGADVVDPDTTFTVEYTYDGLDTPGTLTVTPGATTAGPDLPVGTEVTLSEVTPTGDLPDGYDWDTPVFVLPDGTTTDDSVTFTIAAGETVAIELDNPVTAPTPSPSPSTSTTTTTSPPLPNTGAGPGTLAALIGGALLVLAGLSLAVGGRRRKGRHAA